MARLGAATCSERIRTPSLFRASRLAWHLAHPASAWSENSRPTGGQHLLVFAVKPAVLQFPYADPDH
jgi:hypothetical protein